MYTRYINISAYKVTGQWRSALFIPQVMVKGEGLRVVKHNRSGGSQMRIIRYDPDIKALVWNSKRYMKKGQPPLEKQYIQHIA